MTDAFMPLLRTGLDPVPDLRAWGQQPRVGKLEFPFGISAWLVTRYQDVRQVLADATTYSNDFNRLATVATGETPPATDPGGLGFADPPDHTRLRKLLTPEFTMRRLARLQPRIEAIVTGQLDEMAAAGGVVDLVDTFAMPIPSLVICELLGIPYEDREDFQKLSQSRFDLFANLGDPLGAITESLRYLKDLVQRKRENATGDGMLDMLIRENGDQISDDELAGLADGLLTGGHETTASMLSLGALVLLQRPDLASMLRDSDEYTNPMVEDLLRYLTVVQVGFPRFARQDTAIGGVQVKAGEMVLLSLSGADRDPALVPEPDRVDPGQAVAGHLAFSHGIHRCVGAELARMELRTAYPALVRRFPELRLAVDWSEIGFHQYSIVHGVAALPVTIR